MNTKTKPALNIDCNVFKNKNLIIALSGGIDSVVLLHFLVNNYPKKKIKAIYINHNLCKNSNNWDTFCKKICKNYNIGYQSIDIRINSKKNIEKIARDKRYQTLLSKINTNDILLTAHHYNDQAETFLLQLFRGAGVNGLSAMPRVKIVQNKTICRPLLNTTKEDIIKYAKLHKLSYIEDDSNLNTDFRRNFIRLEVIPLLTKYYGNIYKIINKSVSHQQEALLLLTELAIKDIQEYKLISNNNIIISKLKILSNHRINNVLRYYFKANNIKQPSAKVLQQITKNALNAKLDAKTLITWDKYKLRCYQDNIYILTNDEPPKCDKTNNFANTTNVKVRYRDKNIRCVLENQKHSKPLKKILQEHKIPPWHRDKLAMYYLNGKLVAMQGIGRLTEVL